jgi:hypothetical protein
MRRLLGSGTTRCELIILAGGAIQLHGDDIMKLLDVVAGYSASPRVCHIMRDGRYPHPDAVMIAVRIEGFIDHQTSNCGLPGSLTSVLPYSPVAACSRSMRWRTAT